MKIILAKIALPFVRLYRWYLLKRMEKEMSKKWKFENEIKFLEVKK